MDYKELVEQLKRKGLSNGSSLGHHSGLYDEAATAITDLLNRAESAEKKLAECEPKHGYWVIIDGDLVCSECGTVSNDFTGDYIPKYCQECGAKMDEKE